MCHRFGLEVCGACAAGLADPAAYWVVFEVVWDGVVGVSGAAFFPVHWVSPFSSLSFSRSALLMVSGCSPGIQCPMKIP